VSIHWDKSSLVTNRGGRYRPLPRITVLFIFIAPC
jgi:hypothetical protein